MSKGYYQQLRLRTILHMGIFNVMEGLVLASERVMDDNARSTPTTLISTPNWLLGSLDGTTWVGKDQLVSRLIQLLLSAFIMGCCFAQLPSCHISREVYPIQIASVSLRSILNSQPSMERLDLHRYLPLIENFPSVFPNLDLGSKHVYTDSMFRLFNLFVSIELRNLPDFLPSPRKSEFQFSGFVVVYDYILG
ncbi:hypothetical protein VNO77_20395 [Canavalia gladiata]|uniref:Uncharacterized protein n=1 Tax=Canavalia gladiata TaxID=3824 RepID=A0AAN9LSP6_CANGL